MPTNDFKPFATDPAAAVLSQAAYEASTPSLGRGPGIVPKEHYNKSIRQGAVMAAALGAFMSSKGQNALDDGNVPQLALNIAAAVSGAGAGGFSDQQLAADGWQRFPGGLLLQWGSRFIGDFNSGTSVAARTLTFPTPFTAVFRVLPGFEETATVGSVAVFNKGLTQWVAAVAEYGDVVENATICYVAIGV